VAVLSSLRGTGLLVLLGAIVGVFIAVRRVTFAPATTPFVSLLRTIRPLLLPLLVVVAVGAVGLGPIAQIVIGASSLLIAWYLILRPERAQFKATLAWEGRLVCVLVSHFWRIIAIGIPAAFALKALAPGTRHFEALGDVPSALLLGALLAWLAATLLRLFSYGTSWLRALVALSIALAGARVAMQYGFAPEISLLTNASSTVYLAGAAGLLLLESILDVIAAVREGAGNPDSAIWHAIDPILGVRAAALPLRTCQAAARWGYSAALIAALALAISVSYGLASTNQPGEDLATPTGERVVPEQPLTAPGKVRGNLTLAREYAPVLALTHDERWSPTAVESYFSRPPVAVQGPPGNGSREVTSLDDLEGACPEHAPAPCYKLSIDCPSGSEPCAEPRPEPTRSNDRLYRQGAVYYRVERKGQTIAAEREAKGKIAHQPENVFVEEGPFPNLSILLQYWYFYRYDESESTVFAGQLVQKHEGDWEVVTIGLSDQKPLFVAYSAHCAGTWRYWREIEVSDQLPRPWTHPLVAVAEGSHANYPKADQKRSPDWAHCSHLLPAATSTAIDYASNIRDRTEYGWLWYPAANGWYEADAAKLPMSFPGTWGAEDTTTLINFKENRLNEHPGPGPASPPLQASWRKPIPLIFCEGYTGPAAYHGCKEE
jgi:hypothetical protein